MVVISCFCLLLSSVLAYIGESWSVSSRNTTVLFGETHPHRWHLENLEKPYIESWSILVLRGLSQTLLFVLCQIRCTDHHWRSFSRAKPGHGPPFPGEKRKFIPMSVCVAHSKLGPNTHKNRSLVGSHSIVDSWLRCSCSSRPHPWR